MNERAADELAQARERLRLSREYLHSQFSSPGAAGGGASLAQTLVARGLQALTGIAGGTGGLKLGLALAAALVMMVSRRRMKAGGVGLLLSLAFAAIKFTRRR